jgi:uncharacterized protein HemY
MAMIKKWWSFSLRRRILWWLLMFALLVTIVWLAGNNEGYVLIVRSPYRLQFSFNFFLILMVLSFLAVHYCLRVVHFFRRLPANKRSKKDSQRLKDGNAALLEGMQALAEGNIIKAEAAAQRAHTLMRSEDLELLMRALSEKKLKSEAT